jgi:hypothetical protein
LLITFVVTRASSSLSHGVCVHSKRRTIFAPGERTPAGKEPLAPAGATVAPGSASFTAAATRESASDSVLSVEHQRRAMTRAEPDCSIG